MTNSNLHSTSQRQDERIAVVGMAVQYSGCRNKEEFWDSLMKGKTNSSPVKSERLYTRNKNFHLVNERSKYSDSFCNDRYAFLEDVQNEHDLLLRLAKNALADKNRSRTKTEIDALKDELTTCGIVSGCLSFPSDKLQGELMHLYDVSLHEELPKKTDCNLFDGNVNQGTWSLRPEHQGFGDKRFYKDPASFVADELNLSSLHYSVDAACASALYVLKLAQEHLLSGKVDMMLCGGTCLPEPMFILTGFSTFQALPLKDKPGDISLPLHKNSSGLTPGEGGAIMVLKRFSDAIRDGDDIYGTLLGVGINNSGTGLPLKPHLPSQILCLQETYDKIRVDTATVQYVECHATGTPQGDRCEVNAMKAIFKSGCPLFGSTKGNFGHTLVAAGFAGMTKVLLSMNANVIPMTPGVADVENKIDGNVVSKNIPWPDTNLKRAGLSAFGFGGTNAHAVFEEYNPLVANQQLNSMTVPRNTHLSFNSNMKMAIVGMGAHFGTLKTLASFESAIYHGGNGACDLPKKRWRFLADNADFRARTGLPADKTPRGCFVGEIDVDYARIRTPLTPEDQLLPQQLLAITTIDEAIVDSGIPRGGRVACLVGLGTDLELYRHRARVALREQINADLLADNAVTSKLMDFVNDRGTSTSYTSYIGNLVATRVSSQWGFTGPSFTVTEGESSVYRCLEIANELLSTGQIDAAVIAGVDMCGSAEHLLIKTTRSKLSGDSNPSVGFSKKAVQGGYFIGEGCGAFVIKRLADTKDDSKSKSSRVYCSLDSIQSSNSIADASSKALTEACISPQSIDMIEVTAEAGETAKLELHDLMSVYSAGAQRNTIALTSVAGNVGYQGYASGAASIIKSALCIYNRYLPQTPNWDEPFDGAALEDNSFYVNPTGSSRAWVKNSDEKRHAAVNGCSETGSCFHLIMSEVYGQHQQHNIESLNPQLAKLLTISADAKQALVATLKQMLAQLEVDMASDLTTKYRKAGDSEEELFYRLVRETVANEDQTSACTLCVVTTPTKLLKELKMCLRGVERAIAGNKDFLSPSGSYFTASPISSDRVAFMYGDGASAYLNLGQDLHRIVPSLHELINDCTTKMWNNDGSNERWNPRTVSQADNEACKTGFTSQQVDMFRCGVFHSVCFTQVARKFLNLQPKAGFGLSMGEVAMLIAFDENNSKKSDIMTSRLNTSSVWTEDLAVKFKELRRLWGFNDTIPNEKIWQAYLVHASKTEVERAIATSKLQHVRLIIVNDNKTCLVAGVPEECIEIIKLTSEGGVLKPGATMPVPQGMVGHCKETLGCLDQIAYIHEHILQPAIDDSQIELFTSVGYQKVSDALKTKSMNRVIADIYSILADFPRMTDVVYDAGYDVFVELGANNHRAAAVGNILAGKKHLAVAIDQKAQPAWTTMMKMLSKLIGNNVGGVKLSGIYHPRLLAARKARSKMLRTIVVNGRFKGISPNDIPAPLKAKLGVAVPFQSKTPITPPDQNKLAHRCAYIRASAPSGSAVVMAAVKTTVSTTTAPSRSDDGGVVPRHNLKGDPLAPTTLHWHPLAGKHGNPTPSFTPTAYPPRACCFVPFPNNPNDNNHIPGQLPLSWFNMAEFMCGKVSRCLGDEFKRFDVSTTSRSPAFDLQMVTRVLKVDDLEYGKFYNIDVNPSKGTMTAEFDCPADAWFFKSSCNDAHMPYSILMEIGLQTSGILTSWVKAPLTMDLDNILFRNLDATAELIKQVDLRGKTITNFSKCTGFSKMGPMGIHRFEFELSVDGDVFYKGSTSFGWFVPEAFLQQVGLDNGAKKQPWHVVENQSTTKFDLTSHADRVKLFSMGCDQIPNAMLKRRSGQCEFLDSLVINASSGKHGKGYISGQKTVDKQDWFFSCHFWCDPVMPGSLGIESMFQSIELFCIHENLAGRFNITNPTFNHGTGKTSWKYRGQLTPKNNTMDNEVHIKSVTRTANGVEVIAEGFLYVDNLRVYSTENLRVTIESNQLLPVKNSGESMTPLSLQLLHQKLAVVGTAFNLAVKNDQVFETNQAFGPNVVNIYGCDYANLGDQSFMKTYGVDYPMYTGAMAKGIASADLVIAAGKRRMLASLGAGGLPPDAVKAALDKIQAALPNGPYAVNLIHSPFDDGLERSSVDLFLKRGVHVVEASAFMTLTIHVVRYRVAGLKCNNSGSIVATNKIIGKVSRTELAEMFIRPAPKHFVDKLLSQGLITAEQAVLSQHVPMADDIAVESDSGGHTDNRPIHVILPLIIALRNQISKQLGYAEKGVRVRVGAGGGIGCPSAALAAYEMGAAFVITGTINQVAKQSGSSDYVRKALSKATYSDIAMAPAADMFDQGVELQVLKKGTMFPSRAKKLYELFCKYDSLEAMPPIELRRLEKRTFRKPLSEVWEETKDFYINRLHDEDKIKRAEVDGKLKMSLCFRWYLGLSSLWANIGLKERVMDMQVWCGPAIGSYNDFVQGSYLDPDVAGEYPCVVQVNLNVLKGACYLRRLQQIRHNAALKQAVDVDADTFEFRPTVQL